MAHKLHLLIQRSQAPIRADRNRPIARAPLPVELPLFKPEPWLRERDVRDALMAFALVFSGAMIFLL